ncbi:hypothetical protein Z052_02065 [Halorubrum sp. C191]|uniref:hypothetical protein n=1 Tax=Halorubrum sp. C191 TaxID=1383842 RepID=UPI000C084A2D|nr:hypothetical protein [Halorubrum sp. C191]PHQ43948.1 hypothetical protein Z052_02065 [Halorubrum sp. C191]
MSSVSDLTLRIEHQSGGVSELVVPTPVAIDEELVTLASIRIERSLDKVERCTAVVFRDEWLNVVGRLDRRNDELYVVDADGADIFGGRLDDWQFRGETVEVQIDSWERDPREMEPPPSFSRSDASDASIAADLVDVMPSTITAGTIEETTASLGYSAEHVAPAVMLRRLSRSTAADIQYHPDGTVDYLERRGTDQNETLSPSSGAIIGEPRIRRSVREDTTHVRAVSQSDPTVYEEAEAVSVASDEREVWKVDRINSTNSSRLQARATRLANEVAEAPKYLEVEVQIDPSKLSSNPQIGDTYHLSIPASGIDEEVRLIEVDRTIDDRGDILDRVILSNRKLTVRSRVPYADE